MNHYGSINSISANFIIFTPNWKYFLDFLLKTGSIKSKSGIGTAIWRLALTKWLGVKRVEHRLPHPFETIDCAQDWKRTNSCQKAGERDSLPKRLSASGGKECKWVQWDREADDNLTAIPCTRSFSAPNTSLAFSRTYKQAYLLETRSQARCFR